MRSMMKRNLTLSVAFCLLCLNGCAALSVPKQVPTLLRADSSGIGISLKIRAPVALFSRSPDIVFFVRTDGVSGIRQTQPRPSNYARDGRAYFLNLPPGSYAAVAAVSFVEGRNFITYFPRELIEQTLVNVRNGEVAFMGHYVVDQSVGLSEADPIQLHYADVIAPGSAKSGFGVFLSRDVNYRGSISEARRDTEARNEFLSNAKDDLAEGGWTALIAPSDAPPRPATALTASVPINDEIYQAIQTGDIAKANTLLAKELVKQNPKLASIKVPESANPLHLAASVGRTDVVDLLLTKGEDPNSTDEAGLTPLAAAATLGHNNVVEFLLSKGANVNSRDKVYGLTVLHYVVSVGRTDTVHLLLANKADIHAKAKNGATPLHSAALHGRKDMVELLLAQGADINARDNIGLTPLSMAAMGKFTEVIAVLRRGGAKD